ncbi:MAG TPA: hypothetical protein VL463_35795 [Kofleriaceae bacterium]|jgi:hypothetical protein|nr:hypothetical protein [Kofleriaceae bacterium]
MKRLLLLALAACRAEVAAAPSAVKHEKPGALAAIAREKICMTRGEAAVSGGVLQISDATTRGVATTSSGEAAALRFTYRGESRETRALASGQIRHQVGLKLRAADGCNVIYVMWRVEPKPFIEVSMKRNPGKRTHEDCGAAGYTKIKPSSMEPVGAFAVGDEHVLEAAIDGDTLTATLDGKAVWVGDLPTEARALDGPAGFRSDNVTYDAELRVAPGARGHDSPGCAKSDDD